MAAEKSPNSGDDPQMLLAAVMAAEKYLPA
jgi:hypothetical protein